MYNVCRLGVQLLAVGVPVVAVMDARGWIVVEDTGPGMSDVVVGCGEWRSSGRDAGVLERRSTSDAVKASCRRYRGQGAGVM